MTTPRERSANPEGVRLQKVLAAAGMGSRRANEVLIDEGRVQVNGQVVREQGRRVDPASDIIHVDGLRVTTAPDLMYLMLNKPKGVITAMSDPEDRPTVGDYVADKRDKGLFHVGRLDAESEGLLLLTNDGDLGHRLTHPRYGVAKTYLAEIFGPVGRGVGKRLRDGIELEDGFASVDSFRLLTATGKRVMVEVVLHEGRKHVVRRLLAEVGHPVQRLVRTKFGPLELGDLRAGRLRKLGQGDIGALHRAVGL
ncbi:MAG: rRNA pseudouridine synthase [Actinomycetota bacterium]|jgi:23S rRNA pseudouridine2605 synthase|nr:rRNA pseudouridine synthase [Actinomycetota bacterium]